MKSRKENLMGLANKEFHQENGFVTFRMIFFLLSIFAVIFYFIIRPMYAEYLLDTFKESSKILTFDQKMVIDKYKKIPFTHLKPSGLYSGEISNKKKEYDATIRVRYYFGSDNVLTKEIAVVGRYDISGSAKYRFEGSVILFNDIKGDKVIFPESGEVIVMENENLVLLAGKEKFFLKPEQGY